MLDTLGVPRPDRLQSSQCTTRAVGKPRRGMVELLLDATGMRDPESAALNAISIKPWRLPGSERCVSDTLHRCLLDQDIALKTARQLFY